jgi:putative membrane protein
MIEQCTAMMRHIGGMMNGMMGGGMMDGGMMNGMMGPMLIGMLLFWGLVIVGLVLLVRMVWSRISTSPNALSTLQERLARGEIDREEYGERRRVLQNR